jgi:mannose-1-phosphate guanylyltransferase/mannose-6-phosphate isomerase
MINVIPVILCGGSGTRLWPLSRAGFPKQFLVLSADESKQSLFQQAIERVRSVSASKVSLGKALIVTNEEHRFLALDQLRELNQDSSNIPATLLLEPSGRNTAPALTLAALYAQEQGLAADSDPILIVTPADQTVKNTAAFTKALQGGIFLGFLDYDTNVSKRKGIKDVQVKLGRIILSHGKSFGAESQVMLDNIKDRKVCIIFQNMHHTAK